MPPSKELGLPQALGLWALAALGYAAARVLLFQAHGLPYASPGLAILAACLLALAWLAVDPPRLAPGGSGALWRLALALALLLAGEAAVYYRVEGKDKVLAPALALLLAGGGALAPWAARRSLPLYLSALALALLGGLAGRGVNILVELPKGHPAAILSWLALAGSAGLLARLWAGPEPAQPVSALPRRQEALWLGAILMLALALRLWKLGEIPANFWYDEVNLARATQERVLEAGRAPLYVPEQVENPGAYLWVGSALFKAFGAGVQPYRALAAFFGLLALLPFHGLARLWLGARWALAATALFACMRWTLIPQRIGFMSGFALFWMLSAFYFLWSALLRRRLLDWAALGLCLGANLHTYTPSRAVPLLAALFLLLHWRRWAPQGWKGPALALGGFLLTGGPMLSYMASHWSEYTYRSAQVSVMNDVRAQGWQVLWGTFIKHALMFNFRGDFNARHNLHFYPHLDFLMAAAALPALLRLHLQAFRDWRARFSLLWFWPLLAGGILSMAVEAPQGHRSILVAPLLPLAIAGLARSLAPRLGAAFQGGLPLALKLAAACLLLGSLALNAHEYFTRWAPDAATWRGFSPRSSAIARLAMAAPPDQEVFLSGLPKEYQFHGYEAAVFTRFFLRRQDRSFQILRMGALAPGYPRPVPPASILAIWVESDADITAAMKKEYPDIPVHIEPDPFDPVPLYYSAVIPFERLPEARNIRAGQNVLLRR